MCPLLRGNSLLAAEHIDAGYGPVQVLFDVNLHVAAGELVGICGPNGVGKSTLMRVLSGLSAPSAGTVRLDDLDITRTPAARRPALGMTTVVGQLAFGSLTVAENLRLHGYAVRGGRAAVAEALDGVYAVFPRLYQRRHQPAAYLSGGERQMLVLAKALVQRPRLLLIDELSLGLAPVVVGGLLELVRSLGQLGVAALVVEQSVNVAISLVDRIYFMEKGTIVAEHRSADLAEQPELVQSLLLGGHSVAGTVA